MIGPLYLGLLNPDSRPLEGVKNGRNGPKRASEGRALPDPSPGPRRGLKRPPGGSTVFGRTRRPSAGYALPCGHAYRRGGYRLTPSGLRAPARRDRLPKPRALSGRGGRLDLGVLFSEKLSGSEGQESRASPRPQLDRRETGEDWGEAEPLTPNRNEHASWLGVGCFTPPPATWRAPRRPAGGGFGVAFVALFLPKGETYKCAFPIKHREVNPGSDLGVS